MEERAITTAIRARARRQDPVLLTLALVSLSVLAWCALGAAHAATDQSSTQVSVDVDATIAVAPALTTGDTDVTLSDFTGPGQQRNATSDGWRMSTNWTTGYEVVVRSVTDPAMRGRVEIGGGRGIASFSDFTTASCPCPWDVDGFSKGVFGYSATVATNSGPAAVGAAQWGSSSNRSWRGFDDTDHIVFETPGGTGVYDLDLHLRTEIPDGGTQQAGTYRSRIVLGIRPNL